MSGSVRIDRFLKERGLTNKAAAELLGCSAAFVTMMRRGKRPGLALAVRVERLTAGWSEGPIRCSEWCGLDELGATEAA